ncbi:DUF4193 family protein [Micromonospora sp. NPDC050686]|uniref:DUF4193 family protein n=1 Tax=Micromonospora sp. NPDC050686 TaxID=3154631 RepID=UPI0033CAD90E
MLLSQSAVPASRSSAGTGAARVDLQEAQAAGNLELPGAELSGEEVTVAVVPMQPDEFRCARCFLAHHRSQLAGQPDGREVCPDCS